MSKENGCLWQWLALIVKLCNFGRAHFADYCDGNKCSVAKSANLRKTVSLHQSHELCHSEIPLILRTQ